LQRLGVGLQTIESILGHISGSRSGNVAVYQRYAFEAEKRAALEAWAQEIERITSGKKERTPEVHFAEIRFSGSGSLAAYSEEPIDVRWLEALEEADRTSRFDPMVAYLRLPDARMRSPERFLLRTFLEQTGGIKWKRGRRVRFRQESMKDRYKIGDAYVHNLMQTEKLSREKAIDRAVKSYPKKYFGDETGVKLANAIKRGLKRGSV
jgi:hypothetical protein